jgi:hypothetical protein
LQSGWLVGWLLAELVLLVRYMVHFSFREFIYCADPGQPRAMQQKARSQ